MRSAHLAVVASLLAIILTSPVAAARNRDGQPWFAVTQRLEVGLYLDGLFPSSKHEWYDPAVAEHQPLGSFAFGGGLRLGYWPLRLAGMDVGAELEGGLNAARTAADQGLLLLSLRGHAIAQLPIGRFAPFGLIGMGGAGHSSEADVLGSDADLLFHWGIGAKFAITDAWSARLDLRHVLGPRAFSVKGMTPHAEVLVGASWLFDLGAAGESRPESAVVVPVDQDGDGVNDVDDQCPTLAGPPPKGCPQVDSDNDGIFDHEDRCPDEAEDVDGFEDEDGCPDEDNDRDGIPDAKDKCPNESETLNGVDDEDGCPEDLSDGDKDGVADVIDKCPNDPEDRDGFEDADGCPDPDNDKDGVVDGRDSCPDKQGPEENAGCPDIDTDNDGVPDRLDNCPNDAGKAEFFGCKKKQLVKLSSEKIEILQRVFFATGKTTIEARSNALLDNIAKVMKDHAELKKVRVEGHTDNVGSAQTNLTLSQGRAEAVVQYLVEQGVDPSRVEAVGYGQDNPIMTNTTNRGRSTNRRVEFKIVAGD